MNDGVGKEKLLNGALMELLIVTLPEVDVKRGYPTSELQEKINGFAIAHQDDLEITGYTGLGSDVVIDRRRLRGS